MTDVSPAIDLRSDTVTRPNPAMRKAMAEADVGDDVYGEDPTVARLQERVADIVGTEAALFVPSGTMANQIAIHVHTRPGDEVLAGQSAHNWRHETGAAAALSGVQITLLPGDGRFRAADIRAAYKPDDHHSPSTRLVSVENTHNMSGGMVWDMVELRAVKDAARSLGLALHLDGARLWNASVASGLPVGDIASGFDTVSVCLSKGMGAPVGSVLCGSRPLIREAHRVRKMLGGGMRQAGILAAAGIYALDHNRERLVEDHENAAFLARALAGVVGLSVEPERVATNIVMVDMHEHGSRPAVDAKLLSSRAAERGVRFHALSDTRVRLVTHMDVTRKACEHAVAVITAVLGELGAETR